MGEDKYDDSGLSIGSCLRSAGHLSKRARQAARSGPGSHASAPLFVTGTEESYVQWIRRFIVYHHKGRRKQSLSLSHHNQSCNLDTPKIMVASGHSFQRSERLERKFVFDWHCHPEIELTSILEFRSLCFIVDYRKSEPKRLAENLPHIWVSHQPTGKGKRCQAIVVRIFHEP